MISSNVKAAAADSRWNLWHTGMGNMLTATGDGKIGVGIGSPNTTFEVATSTGSEGISISKTGSGFGSGRLSFGSDRSTANEWRPGYIESGDEGSFTGRLNFYTNGTGVASKTGLVRGMSLVNKALIVGNNSFGITQPEYQLHVVSNTNGLNSPVIGSGGMFGIGNTNAGHMGMTTGAIDAWFNTNGTTLNLNFYSKGKVKIGSTGDGNLEVSGYTKLGDAANVPNIKMKKLFGTMTNTATTDVSHGLTRDKILAVDIHVNN